jgi:signal peptidase I
VIKPLFDLLVLALSVIALPVIAICLYDQFVLGPKRPLTGEGVPAPGPAYVRVAYQLLPFVIIAAVIQIGVQAVFGWFNQLVVPLSVLALPVAMICAYDHWVLSPKRPKTPEGYPTRPPHYIRIAYAVLPFVLIAVVLLIGPAAVFDLLKTIAVPLSWFAAPVGLWCLIDSWFLAPRRQIAAGSVDVVDPPFVRAAYLVLPVLVVAVIVRMITAEKLDFSLVLFSLSVATGLIWLIDRQVVSRKRDAAAAAAPKPIKLTEPGTVDYARSFFPVAFIVLLVRAFIFEPFRIPSDSMMPTLLDGDFIVVSKYSYGLRLPIVNRKFIDTDVPQRGDIVVFRYPRDPNINYIKRLVGLPGDRIEVRGDQLIVNGEAIPQQLIGDFTDGCYVGMRKSIETIGGHTHDVLSCRSSRRLLGAREVEFAGGNAPPAVCDRKKIAQDPGGWICSDSGQTGGPDNGDYVFDVVPAGHYLMIGDNRDNSEDSRRWGFVPDKNLVGKATRIWFNLDLQRPQSQWINWDRIGDSIE